MVPAIMNAEKFSLKDLSIQIRDLADKCRNGNIDPELIKSENASFTITNLGSFGIEFFTPVLNLPQTAILGINTITYRPTDLGDGTIGIIPVIGLSLSYDHRSVDGAPASLFLKDLKTFIENLSID
jgi:pyruvate dehydrogenase E2 component (dihydrolipoamide acetyltransferase)